MSFIQGVDRSHCAPRSGWVLVSLLLAGCKGCQDQACYTQLYRTEPIAPGLEAAAVEALDYLGPTLIDQGCAKGVNFGAYSERGTRVDLLLFDDDKSEKPTRQLPMTRYGDVWNLYVEGIGEGQRYGYVAWGPNWVEDPDWYCGSREGFVADVDDLGNRFNPNKLLTDPYALAFTRDFDWGLGSAGTGESRRADCTWDASPKSVVMTSDYVWGAAESTWRQNRQDEGFTGHGPADLILYEVHVKGFTQNGVEGVEHQGTYRGLGEKAAYFAELGVTAVELLPVHEKGLDGGYWGYNNVSFFAPELTYSADYAYDGPPQAVIDEFKWMVEQLHGQGIEVVLDVVYNHTGEGGLWRDKVYTDDSLLDPDGMLDAYNLDTVESATIYNMRGLDNAAWYALSLDNQSYWNNTGVGNETRANHTPMRRLILDSLRFYVEELHVDGFRFDLAGILGERDLDYNNWDDPAATVLQEIIDDPVLQKYNTRIIAEPWTAGGSYNAIGAFPASTAREGSGWAEWNASFRDWWRSIMNIPDWTLNGTENGADGGSVMTGTELRYGWNGRRPYHSVNFVTCHDGFTMYDLFTYTEKVNNCGPLNPICCDDPTSSWCDTDSGESHNRSADWVDESLKRQMMRNSFVAMMISHGTPMILGGDEWARTQYGNNNAYSTGADNEWNWYRWGEWQAQDERWRLFNFVAGITRFRREHSYAFAPTTYGGGMSFAWKDANNSDAGGSTWGGRHLMIHYYDDGRALGPELVILINMEAGDVSFTLPTGPTWLRAVDTQAYFDSDAYLDSVGLDRRSTGNLWTDTAEAIGGAYTVPAHTIVILEASEG